MYLFLIFYPGAVMLLSSPAKKVTKECGIGEALRLVAPAPEPMNYGMIATGNHCHYKFAARSTALPYVPHPARSNQLPEKLNGQDLLSGCCIMDSGGSALAALPG